MSDAASLLSIAAFGSGSGLRAGYAVVDITPHRQGELCGFALREQPSEGVLDPIFVRALFLSHGTAKLLWLHADLIGFTADSVAQFRRWAAAKLLLAESSVLLSATHTHSGPGTLGLEQAGAFDARYVEFIHERMQEAAQQAAAETTPCAIVGAQAHLDLAIDRRGHASAHTDPIVNAVGFRDARGRLVAVILNYAIHPVALGHVNRRISGDLLGFAARALKLKLADEPVVLATNGACGNLNPPAVSVELAQAEAWGEQIAQAISRQLETSQPEADQSLATALRRLPLPLEVLSPEQLSTCVAASREHGPSESRWRRVFDRVLQTWEEKLRQAWREDRVVRAREAELFAVRLGPVVILGVNAEIFSVLAPRLREAAGPRAFVVGYANGNLGYICPRPAYLEGGYEVNEAHYFYGGYRFAEGAYERLADAAAGLVRELAVQPQGGA